MIINGLRFKTLRHLWQGSVPDSASRTPFPVLKNDKRSNALMFISNSLKIYPFLLVCIEINVFNYSFYFFVVRTELCNSVVAVVGQ